MIYRLQFNVFLLGNIIIPRIEWHFTTSRVLVMEYIDGIKVTDVESLQKNHISTSSVLFKIHSLFQRMIFHYGFLHCDPHPGNIMVLPASIDPKESNLIRKLKIWIFGNDWKLVILDHGLYKCLSLDLRNVYAHLWLNILQGNEHEMKRNFSTILDLKKFLDDSDSLRTTLDHARLYRLFSCILTQRSWDSIQKGILTSESSFFYTTPTTYASELALIKKRAPQYFHDTLVLLNVLPRDFLLLIKTNELLRYLDRTISLKGNDNLSLSYLLVVKSALAFIRDFEKQSPWKIFRDYWSIVMLLQLFRI